MDRRNLIGGGKPALCLESAARCIVKTQRADGEIPWFAGDKTDPWDHVEAAMGLSVAGFYAEARKAFTWLAGRQLADGSWYAAYRNGEPDDYTKEANMTAYVATGMFHYYLITEDVDFLRKMWKTIHQAISFTLSLCAENGTIYWAKSPEGMVDQTALLTGSSSIFMSLKCALAIAETLGYHLPAWKTATQRLGDAIRYKPHCFDATKSRFSMDWFYPVLCGAISGKIARQRIDNLWNKFVIDQHGALCVCDEPWITIAETCELCLALDAVGQTGMARNVFAWIDARRYPDGSFWCGYTWTDGVIWPEHKYTWTNGVALMAADALYGLTPAARLFHHSSWDISGRWIADEPIREFTDTLPPAAKFATHG